MQQLIQILATLLLIIIHVLIIKRLIKRGEGLSPYMFFYIMITIELVGPIIYYYVLNGDSYKSFSGQALLYYYIISIFAGIVMLIQVSVGRRVRIKGFSFSKRGGEESLFIIYMVLIGAIVTFYLIRYRHQLLLVNVLRGNTENLVRSDTSGLIPHWYTVSSFVSLILPSFYFYFYKKIKSEKIQYILFFAVAILTMIDGNKGLFIYLVLFMFMYVYRFKVNKYVILSVIAAFFLYYLLKAGNVSQIGTVINSGIRRFFVTQGACFINRIQMVLNGYDFSQTQRISTDVFAYMYHYSGGAAPTVFWGDIFVKYGFIGLLPVIVISNWILYRLSQYIAKTYTGNIFMYWTYASVAYMLCMSELSVDHLLRIAIVVINCLVFLATVGDINRTANIELEEKGRLT